MSGFLENIKKSTCTFYLACFTAAGGNYRVEVVKRLLFFTMVLSFWIIEPILVALKIEYRLNRCTLRKHAYSNILKIVQPKTRKFPYKNYDIF